MRRSQPTLTLRQYELSAPGGTVVVNRFDASIVIGLNSLVGRSPSFDSAIALLGSSELLKGAVFVSLLWWHWFRAGDTQRVRHARGHLAATLTAGLVGIVLARTLALMLPFRIRPRFEPELHFAPVKSAGAWFVDWSGFPSDHAVIFAALTFGLGYLSKRLGVFAFVYMLVVVALPRVYLGYHYPTDILAGLAIGIAVAYCFNAAPLRERIAAPLLRWEQHHASSFYVALFLLSYQLATMFNSLRDIASAAVHLVERLLK